MKYKKYTLLEALALMKKGKKVCMTEGHDHPTGSYFTIQSIYFIQHNGDGTVYRKSTGMFIDWIDGKKKWVIKKNYDGLRHHTTIEEIQKKEKLQRIANYDNSITKKSFFREEIKVKLWIFLLMWFALMFAAFTNIVILMRIF